MTKFKFLALCLALVLLLAACGGNEQDMQKQEQEGSVQNEQNVTETEQKTGTVLGGVCITEAGTVTEKCNFISGDILYRTENDKVQLLDLNGKETTEKLYDEVELLIGDGVVIVSEESSDAPKWGVVNSYTGKELVACEAVDVQKLNDRYLLINYYTAAGTQEDHYSFYNDGEIIYYNGYGKVLDLKQERFVPGLEVTDDVVAAGDMLYVDQDALKTEVFDADGKSQGVFEYLYAYSSSGISLLVDQNGFTVYDGSFKKAGYVTTDSVGDFDPVDGVADMLNQTVWVDDTAMHCLTDLDGKALTENFGFIGAVSKIGFSATKEYGGDTGYVAMDGTVLVPFEYKSVFYVEPGYLLAQKTVDSFDVYSVDGKKLNTEAVKGDLSQCAFFTEKGFFAPETGKTVEAPYAQYLGYGLLKNSNDAYTSTIYCARTGEVVFEEVESCVCIGENLYIWDSENEVYNRYILSWA